MDADYVAQVEAHRKAKDEAFRHDPYSPIDHHLRAKFTGLNYFPVAPEMRIRVRLEPHAKPARIMMETRGGTAKEYANVGQFTFDLDGHNVTIHAYDAGVDHELFVPFRDATSGKESYGAGCYLEVEKGGGGEHILDLNLAYNPFCAYNDAYSCPFPPPANWLKVPIRAGERSFDH